MQNFSCSPVVKSSIYVIIRSRVERTQYHGYNKVEKCNQSFYEDVREQGETNHTLRAEKYADAMFKKYGTGMLNFQFPDSAFYSIDFGYVTFPAEFSCSESSNISTIFLSLMVTVDSFRVELLNTFINYYIGLGIKPRNILLTVQVLRSSEVDRIIKIIDLIVSKGVYYDIFIGKWSSEALMFHQAHKLLHCTKAKDWNIVADSDEFHGYPTNDLRTFLRHLDSENINVVNGLFLDRVSSDGSLKALRSTSSIFAQFELGCRIHKTFRLGTPKKVMAFKGNLRINRGHHRLALCWFWNRRNYLDISPWSDCPPNEVTKINPYPDRLDVHHFKWM